MVSFEVGGGENAPGIPGACATHDFVYLVRGPWNVSKISPGEEHHQKDMATKFRRYRISVSPLLGGTI